MNPAMFSKEWTVTAEGVQPRNREARGIDDAAFGIFQDDLQGVGAGFKMKVMPEAFVHAALSIFRAE
jgi:hypothetical protein